jgi:hypothetical protein
MPATYQNRIVSFIDILGFANAIERSASDPALTDDIYAALRTAPFSSPLHGPPNYPTSMSHSSTVRSTNFSDSIVISAERSIIGLVTVVEMSRAFSCVLLQLGMLARGGVACGQLIHEDSLIFGPGLVSAYHLESQVSKVARIIMDKETADFAQECGQADPAISEYLGASLRTDCDGLTYLHVLRELGEDVAAGKHSSSQKNWWGAARKTIVDQLAATRGQPFANKVEWFARYYNREIADHDRCDDLDDWLNRLEVSPT